MSIPNYLQPESNRKKSIKKEKNVQRQLNSGALWYHKGDLVDSETMYEHKFGKKQIVVTYEMMNKLFTEASNEGKTPVLILEIGDLKVIGMVIKT